MIKYKLVDVSAIETPSIPQSRSDADIEHFANLYLASGVMTSPLILKEFKPERFRVIHGYDEYYIALRAKQKDLDQAEMVNAFVLDLKATAKEEAAILEQVREAIDRLGGDFGSAGSANNPENDPAKDPIDQALNQTLKSIANTINFEVLGRFSQIEKKLDQLEKKVDKSADLIDSMPPPESRSQSIEQNLGQNLGQNLEKSLSELITRLAQGQLQATIELKTPPETLTVKEVLPPQIQNLKEIYEELSLPSLKKLAKKRHIDLASLLSKPLTKMSTADRPAIIGQILVWHQTN